MSLAVPPATQTSGGQPAPPLPAELQSSGHVCASLASHTPLPHSSLHALQSSGQVEQVSRPLQEPSPQTGPQSVVQSLGQRAQVSPASQTLLPQDAPPVDDVVPPVDDELLADDEDFDDELDLALLSSPPSPLLPPSLLPPSPLLPPEPPVPPVGCEDPSAQAARSAATPRSAAAPTKRNELGRMFMTASS